MKCWQYISESVFVKSLDDTEAQKLLKTKCKKNGAGIQENGFNLHRGDSLLAKRSNTEGNYFEGKERRGADPSIMNLLVSGILPSGKGYPSRVTGLICATSARAASAYGDHFGVVPFDSCTAFAVSNKNDFWFAPGNSKRMREGTFSETVTFSEAFSKGGIDENNLKYALSLTREKFIEEFPEVYAKIGGLIYEFPSSAKMLDILDDLINPTDFKIELVTSLQAVKGRDNEVGLNGPALLKLNAEI